MTKLRPVLPRAHVACVLGISSAMLLSAAPMAAASNVVKIDPGYASHLSTDATSTIQRFTVASKSVLDSSGAVYESGRSYFVGGYGKDSSYSSFRDIKNTPDDAVYQAQWVGANAWNLPVQNGAYRVTLKMREAYWRAPGARVFDVNSEGLRVLRNLDIYAASGRNAAYDQAFTINVSDGMLSLEFKATVDRPLVSAIVVERLTNVATPPQSTDAALFVPSGGPEADQTASLQKLLDSGVRSVNLGNSGRIRACVVVPAGVTLISEGAVLTPVPGGRYIVASGGEGARMVNLRIDATIEFGLVGGETGVSVRHSGVAIQGLNMQANGFRYGVSLEGSGQVLKDVAVTDSAFMGTSYGIYKNNIPTQGLQILRDKFTAIVRGDAVELNMGGDPDSVIADNTIAGVAAGGIMHAGMGIGIAGNGSYGQPESQLSSGCKVLRNTISGVETEAIHLEVMAGCQIAGNNISGAGASQTQTGIAFYGSVNNSIDSNVVAGVDVGIFDALGVSAGQYVRSSNGNRVTNNIVSAASVGIRSMVTGDRTTFAATGNRVTGAAKGIAHAGASQVTLSNNVVKNSIAPYAVDLLPDFAWPLGTATRSLTFVGNSAYTALVKSTTNILSLVNASGATLSY